MACFLWPMLYVKLFTLAVVDIISVTLWLSINTKNDSKKIDSAKKSVEKFLVEIEKIKCNSVPKLIKNFWLDWRRSLVVYHDADFVVLSVQAISSQCSLVFSNCNGHQSNLQVLLTTGAAAFHTRCSLSVCQYWLSVEQWTPVAIKAWMSVAENSISRSYQVAKDSDSTDMTHKSCMSMSKENGRHDPITSKAYNLQTWLTVWWLCGRSCGFI